MAKYESGDMVTYYFVIYDDKDTVKSRIIGWTDEKELAKSYMEFHNCKRMRIKEINDTIEEVNRILNENINDEIKLYNLQIRDPKHKKGKEEVKYVMAPLTETERRFINEEEQAFLASRIKYTFLNGAVPYMKKKYQRILDDIFFGDVLDKVINNRDSKFTREVYFDQLMLLFRSFPEMFGE